MFDFLPFSNNSMGGSSSSSFNSAKLKSKLKLSVCRLELDGAKKAAMMQQTTRKIAELLKQASKCPKSEEKARMWTESVIRDDNTLVAYDIVRLQCEMLSERVGLIANSKSDQCPADLVPCVSSIMWSASRLPHIAELTSAQKQLRRKFGRAFAVEAMNDSEEGVINDKVLAYLSLHQKPPTREVVDAYMLNICRRRGVDWKPAVELVDATTGLTVSPRAAAASSQAQAEIQSHADTAAGGNIAYWDGRRRQHQQQEQEQLPVASPLTVFNSSNERSHYYATVGTAEDSSTIATSSCTSSLSSYKSYFGYGTNKGSSLPPPAASGRGRDGDFDGEIPVAVAVPLEQQQQFR